MDLYPVINRETRISQLAYTVEGAAKPGTREASLVPRVAKVERLVPGLNYVSTETLQKCLGPSIDDPSGRLVIEDPCDMPEYRATSLAKASKSRKALRLWRDAETRPAVIKAIDARLAEVK